MRRIDKSIEVVVTLMQNAFWLHVLAFMVMACPAGLLLLLGLDPIVETAATWWFYSVAWSVATTGTVAVLLGAMKLVCVAVGRGRPRASRRSRSS